MKVGMIGCGNMGGALAEAAAKSIGGSEILIADQSASRLSAMSEKIRDAHREQPGCGRHL